MALVNFFTRVFPFLFFRKKELPSYIVFEDGPFTVQAGDLAHLKTEFRFETADRRCLGNLVELLHPTPAICGLPRKEALHFIKKNEGKDYQLVRCFLCGCVDWRKVGLKKK